MAVAVSGQADIDATPTEVMDVIADFETYPEWSDGHKKATIDTRDANGRPNQVTMAVSAMGFSDEQVMLYEFDGDSKVTWSLVKANQQKAQSGSYTLTPTDSGTHVEWEVSVTPRMPVPDALVRQTLKPTIAVATEGLKKRTESLKV